MLAGENDVQEIIRKPANRFRLAGYCVSAVDLLVSRNKVKSAKFSWSVETTVM